MHHHPANMQAHAIGVALQHTRKSLCRQIDFLANQPDPSFAAGWLKMMAMTEAAFRHEETIMELTGYAGLAAHRAENARILGTLHHVSVRVECGDIQVGREAASALAAIVSAHRYAVGTAPIDLNLRGRKTRHTRA
jgi:hypothetical protein